jgi:hypothetical protein
LENLKRFAADRGTKPNDFNTQVDFAIHELDTTEAKAGNALRNAKNIEDATTAFMHYERPRGYTPDNPRAGDSYNQRLANAAKFANGNFSSLPDKTTAFERITDRTRDNPNLQDAALQYANKIYSAYGSERAQAKAGFQVRLQDSLAEAQRTGAVQQPLTGIDFIESLGPENGPAAYNAYRQNVQLGTDLATVATMSPTEQADLLKKYEPQPGAPGYAEGAKRQDALAKEITRVRALRAKDPEFKARVEGSLAEAARTGKPSQTIPQQEFMDRFGDEDGLKAYNHYRAGLRLGRDAQSIDELSPGEKGSLLQSYEPAEGEDFGDQAKRYDGLRKAIDHSSTQAKEDPGGFALDRLQAVKDAHAAFAAALSDPSATPESRTAAARQFATVTLAEQARIGIPPENRNVLSKQAAQRMVADLTKPSAREGQTTADVAGNIEAQAQLWGDAWPLVYKQVQKDAQPLIRVIGAGVTPYAARVLTELAPLKLPEILKDENTEKSSQIKKDVLDAFKPFAATLAGSSDRLDIFNDFRGQAEKLAAYYVVNGKSSSDAAEQTFKDLLGHKYAFTSSYRIPKDLPYPQRDIEAGAIMARDSLKPEEFAPPRDTMGGLGAEYLGNVKPQALKRDGVWVTAPGDTGLMLIYNDEAVRGKDNQPVTRTWKQLAELSKTATGGFGP